MYSAYSAVHTDTHTYILSKADNVVLKIDRATGAETPLLAYHAVQLRAHNNHVFLLKTNTIECIDTPALYGSLLCPIKKANDLKFFGSKACVSNNFGALVVLNVLTTAFCEHLLTSHIRPIVIHGPCGYICRQFSNCVHVLNLKTNSFVENIPVGNKPVSIHFEGQKGYVVNYDDASISVIDTLTHHVEATITMSKINERNKFFIQDDELICGEPSYTVEQLTHSPHVKRSYIGDDPQLFKIVGNKGYLLHLNYRGIIVADLKTNKYTHVIETDAPPVSFTIHGDKGFAVCPKSNTVNVIDLLTDKLINTLPTGLNPHPMIVHNDFGYIKNSDSKTISVIDLNSELLAHTLENANNQTIDFSDTHLYLGITKSISLQELEGLRLFKYPYTGIEGFHVGENADEAFSKFEIAIEHKDYKPAKEYYDIALSLGHPKTFSVACYAFCKGIWGASQNDTWAMKYIEGMDHTYFLRLTPDQIFPFHFKCSAPQGRDSQNEPDPKSRKKEKTHKKKVKKKKKTKKKE